MRTARHRNRSRGGRALGRYDQAHVNPGFDFDDELFAFNPAARVWMAWDERRPLSVLTRLRRSQPDEKLEPVILDRLWKGLESVRPAGVRALLAVDEEIVRPGKQ